MLSYLILIYCTDERNTEILFHEFGCVRDTAEAGPSSGEGERGLEDNEEGVGGKWEIRRPSWQPPF